MSLVRLPRFEEAVEVVLSSVRRVEFERAGVINTVGRTLAEDVVSERGELVLRSGTLIGGPEMGLLAEAGVHGVLLSRRPRVSVLTIGEDIVDLMEDLTPGKRRNVSRYGLAGKVLTCGCDIGRLLHASDGIEPIRMALQAVRASDLVIIITDNTDLVSQATANDGPLLIDGAAIEPGGATTFRVSDGQPIFTLPGDPCSASILFDILVRPVLSTMLGRTEPCLPKLTAVASSKMRHELGVTTFIPAIAREVDSRLAITSLEMGSMDCIVQSNCIAIIPENREWIACGDSVDVMLTRMPSGRVS